MSLQPPSIVVVGGSLAGLTLALACAHRGVQVQVVERASQRVQGGDSLSVSLAAIASATGRDPRVYPNLPVVPAYRDRHLTTWPALYGWLRDRANETTGISLAEGKLVTSVSQMDDGVALEFADGARRTVDAVIGADGYHSLVRKAVMPDAPLARYAGYFVWRGLVAEQALTRPVHWPADGGLWIDFAQGYRLVAAVLPGRDGSMQTGRRQITFAWFDVHRDDLLRRTNRLTEEGYLIGTLGRDSIDADVRAELVALVPQLWPAMWAEAVTVGLQSAGVLSGAPIAEYLPSRLSLQAMALVGDAAHVVSPMTGSGFATGVEDATVLASALAGRSVDEPLAIALKRYETARLPYVRGLVTHSQQLSAQYVRHAKSA